MFHGLDQVIISVSLPYSVHNKKRFKDKDVINKSCQSLVTPTTSLCLCKTDIITNYKTNSLLLRKGNSSRILTNYI